MFNVESGRQSRASEIEKIQSPEPSEAGETGYKALINSLNTCHLLKNCTPRSE